MTQQTRQGSGLAGLRSRPTAVGQLVAMMLMLGAIVAGAYSVAQGGLPVAQGAAPADTSTATPTNTRAPTRTRTPTNTPAPTNTRAPTRTRTPTSVPTLTPTSTPTPCCVDTFTDATGRQSTFDINGPIATSNPFFQDLGTNGRTCETCHREDNGWTIITSTVNSLFNSSRGLDPLFRTVDGSNSPNADVRTESLRRIAYSMLLSKAVIRVGIGMTTTAQFTLTAVDDPYGFASASELSLFRRPLPTTNLNFLSTVMWDARNTFPGQSIDFDLEVTSNNATLNHAQATQSLTLDQEQQINAFQTGLFSAQSFDNAASSLTASGASGGPLFLADTPFFIGINDPFGGNPTPQPFTSTIFTAFEPWALLPPGSPTNDARLSIARGEADFNTGTFNITGVNGLNDVLGRTTIVGTCGTCHDTPGVGSHSVLRPMNTGVSAGTRRTADMPLYTFQNITTGEVITTTDPGVGLISGLWADIGKFKVPTLRNLAARAPYFHDGSAATLSDVIDFYNTRFSIGITPQHKTDLINFLLAQ